MSREARIVALAAFASLASASARGAISKALVVAVRQADYPADARAAHIEGDVAIKLHIDPDGSLRCAITDNKAPAELRRPSCVLVAGRWPFGANIVLGVPQPTDVGLIVRWKILGPEADANSDFGGATPLSPESWIWTADYPMGMANGNVRGAVKIGFDITDRGRMVNCVVVEGTKSNMLNEATCRSISARALLLPAVGPDGQPKATKGFMTVRWRD